MDRGYIIIFGLVLITNACSKRVDNSGPFKVNEERNEPILILTDPSNTNLYFINKVLETSDHNYLEYESVYNGSGVAIGDINNDSLPDIYLGGNTVFDKLYINVGELKFEDISTSSGINGTHGGWTTGVNMVDINADGLLDIYVCRGGPFKNETERQNKLFINNGDLTFRESAAEYGLDNTNYSIHTAFFDYDLDGDLDMYLMNQPPPTFQLGNINYKKLRSDIDDGRLRTDHFYENIDNKFVERTAQAGLINFGYRLGIAVGDINQDSYPDLYITSDYDGADLMYMNNGDKTFINTIHDQIGHISLSSMGVEMADINNDGFLDIFVVEMAMEDHIQAMVELFPMEADRFDNLVDNKFHYQYMLNTLQLNNGNGSFSEIAQLAGLAKTGWSWSPLFFDIDNDGFKDLYISNGVKHQFIYGDFESILGEKAKQLGRKLNIYEINKLSLTEVTPNEIYRYLGDYKYEKQTGQWMDKFDFNSNGVAYGDLDNDGDLDLVTNNMEANVSLYENKSADRSMGNYVKFNLKGTRKNIKALGSKIKIKKGEEILYQELHNSRGYLSSGESCLIFGLGDMDIIPFTEIIWPDGSSTFIENLATNSSYNFSYDDVVKVKPENSTRANPILNEIKSEEIGITFRHRENEHDDFTSQLLLPYSLSHNGPYIANADVNNDGLEDLFVGGAAGQSGELYLQNESGKFTLQNGPWTRDLMYEDMDVQFFDYDSDGDQDLYVVSGGSEFPEGSENFQDRLYANDGKGNFSREPDALPSIFTSGQIVIINDIDKDGDMDIFIGGRIIPDKYPYSPNSYLLLNENGRFVDITNQRAPELAQIGMVTDAVFVDYDKDGDDDLVVVGEWMPIQLLENKNGTFKKKALAGLEKSTGLWFSIAANDIDQDGDLDLFAGNLGLNSKYRAGNGESFHIYCDDFDRSGTFDIVLAQSYKNELVPIREFDHMVQQLPFIKDLFPTYQSFAEASLNDIFGEQRINNALHYGADILESVFIENLGNGRYQITPLPVETQFSPIMDFEFFDINQDGSDEIISVGNLYNTEVGTPRLDASFGSILKYENGHFFVVDTNQSGFSSKGDARDICIIKTRENQSLFLVANNDDTLNVFEFAKK